jgi:hypothetical protein
MSGWAPKGYVHVNPIGGGGVRCMDCQHEMRIASAPTLSRCSAGIPLAGAAGNWRADRKVCQAYQPRSEQQ